MAKLVLISGSLRRESLNSAAIRAVQRVATATPGVDEAVVLALHRIPFYDGDVEVAGQPAPLWEARELITEADALIISTPAYNGMFPGVLKNALDWFSRPPGRSVLAGRVTAILSASPGPRGGLEAQDGLRAVLARCKADLVEHEPVALRRAESLRDDAGEITDPATLGRIRSLVDATLATVARQAATEDTAVPA
jgi:chromate reductase, NAD(P)H dehydrogenase (quinone)